MKGSEMDDPARRMSADLQALGRSSLSNLPTIHQTVRTLEQAPARRTREGFMTAAIRSMRMRPWLTATLAIAGMAAVLLVVPISYTRTTGYDVRLDLPGGIGALAPDKVIAQFKQCLGTDQVSLSMTVGSGGSMVARVRPGAKSRIETTARTFAQALNERGIPATAVVTPITEQVSNNLVAWAAEQAVTIRVNRDGKTDEQVAAEIRAQLEAAGFQNPTVSVSTEGGKTQIWIKQEHKPGEKASCPETNVVVEGAGAPGGRQAKVMIRQDHPMTDDEIRIEAERQLREQGFEADVVVRDGRITITPRK